VTQKRPADKSAGRIIPHPLTDNDSELTSVVGEKLTANANSAW